MTVAHVLLVGCGLALSAVAANAQSSANKVSKAAAEKTAMKSRRETEEIIIMEQRFTETAVWPPEVAAI